MDDTVYRLFSHETGDYRVVEKIRLSMWRWGAGRGVWNEVVDAFIGLRNFSLDLGSDFELRLDYTTGANERGYSEHARLFIDSFFAFLVYYRGEHVLTIGFSFMANRVLLLQQVQLKNKRGNRFLFGFPGAYLPYIITRMKKTFVKHSLYLIDGHDLVVKNLRDYEKGIAWETNASFSNTDHMTQLVLRRDHLLADSERIESRYAGIAPFRFTKRIKTINALKHREVTD